MWYYKKDIKQISAEPEGYAKPTESEKCIRYECERAVEGIERCDIINSMTKLSNKLQGQ